VVVGKGSSHLHPTFSIVIFVTHQEQKSRYLGHPCFYSSQSTRRDLAKWSAHMYPTYTQP
jgi:hypothetical protein